MKTNVSRMLKSSVALLLALCMVLGMVPAVQVSATAPKSLDTDGDGVINYVSFGDSVTNGYGLDDYRYENGTNVYGLYRTPKASYPALIRDELSKNYTVNLSQMAISGFRMNELAWMLCDDYNKDSYHYYWFYDWNQSAVNGLSREEPAFREKLASEYGVTGYVDAATADRIVMSEYRKAVESAELITIDLGTNNFGTFLTRLVMAIINQEEHLPYETNLADYMDAQTAASLEAMMAQMVNGMVGDNPAAAELAMTMARCLMYGYLGYTENYDKAIEAIYEMNPDVNVVVIDCYSMITGVSLEGDKLDVGVPLSDLYNMFIDMANFYSRELSPYAHKVTHATLDTVPGLFIDYYKDYPDEQYPDNQYLHPTAERLMNEFLMEAMGMDPDDPTARDTFQKDVLNNINALDGYVNNLQETVKAYVIDTIDSEINTLVGDAEEKIDLTVMALDLIYTAIAGEAEARAKLPEAKAGVAQAKAAVNEAVEGVATASEAVDTAVSGVATAQGIVNMLVTELIEHKTFGSWFKGSSTSDTLEKIIIGKIEEKVSDDMMVRMGLEVNAANRTALAEEAYEMACVYKDALNNGEIKETANRLAVLEGIRYMLVTTKGMSNEEAIATAELAWELNGIVNTQGPDAAIKAAIATQMTEKKREELELSEKSAEEAAEIVYSLGTATDTKTAVIRALTMKVDADTAELAYAMVEAYDAKIAAGKSEAAADDAAVEVAIAASLTDEQVAMVASIKPELADRNVLAALILTIVKEYQKAYAVNNSDKEGVIAALMLVATLANLEGLDEETAGTGYDLYHDVYKPALNEDQSNTEEAKAETVLAAMTAQLGNADLAAAVYAIYKGTAKEEQKALAYPALMVNVAGIPQETAAALYTCYTTDLDGQFNDENVKTSMIFLIMEGLGMTQEKAQESYRSYLMYKNMPTTLSKIAKCDTIYFDALLNGAPDKNKIVDDFKNGTLELDKPNADASAEEWANYKTDSAMAVLYFRFLAQEGVFTHPSELGQQDLYDAAMKAINSMLYPEEDDAFEVNADTKMLVLGDFITANPGSYVSGVADMLGIAADNVTNLSNPDFRINDVRALLDSSYTNDAYAQAMIPADAPNYAEAVKANDLIVLNLGAMNMGMIAKQLALYLPTGNTYAMNFSGLENMQAHNLGKNVDALLSLFTPTEVNAVSAMLLTFKTYGYGFTTFADSMAATVKSIQGLNSDAQIVLVGTYDLLGDAYAEDASTGLHLELGHFLKHGLNLMNERMEVYADMTANVTYVDVTGIETNVKGEKNLLAAGMDGLAAAFADAIPTANGYTDMAQRIVTALGYHAFGAWTTEGATSVRTCAKCGYTEHKAGDVFVGADKKLALTANELKETDSGYAAAANALKDIKGEVHDIFVIEAEDTAATVKLPFAGEAGAQKVYRINDDGTLTDMKATLVNGQMVFETEQFGTFAVVTLEGFQLSGKITSYLSETENVTVELIGENGEVAYSATVTGNEAQYVLPTVAVGTYTMQVSKANHVTHSYTVTVEKDTELDAEIYPIGDVTCDGEVSGKDCASLLSHVKGIKLISDEYLLLCADVTNDGDVSGKDCASLLSHVKGIKLLF